MKNTDLSAQLNEQLKQVDKMLTDKEKKEEEKKRSEKAAEEQQNKLLKQQLQLCSTAVAQAASKRHPRPLPLQTQRISQSNLPEQVILPMHLIQHGRGHQVSKTK